MPITLNVETIVIDNQLMDTFLPPPQRELPLQSYTLAAQPVKPPIGPLGHSKK
ncbi:1056_t:CDS:2 [Rhizophagus irregularis]|nr:1056_t:CDS:2 [Rhizophagus irregularis]